MWLSGRRDGVGSNIKAFVAMQIGQGTWRNRCFHRPVFYVGRKKLGVPYRGRSLAEVVGV